MGSNLITLPHRDCQYLMGAANETDIIRLTLYSFCHKLKSNKISVREDTHYEFRYSRRDNKLCCRA